MTRKARLRMVEANLLEAREKYNRGEISKADLDTLEKDGRACLAEIRQRPRSAFLN